MGLASRGATPTSGQVTVTGSAAIVLAAPTGAAQGSGRAGSGVLLKALAGNTQTIWIGSDSTVLSSTGFPLAAGDQLSLPIDDVSKLWAIATSGSQTLCYIYV